MFYVIRLSISEIFFLNLTPKRRQNKKGFSWGFPALSHVEVPTKLYGGKPSLIWTQWTWKPSPRSIGYDGDENGQSRQVQQKNPIHL